MFVCIKCKKKTLEYKGRGVYKCTNCDYLEKIQGEKSSCVRCGETYYEYTWFDPSGCPRCHKSFVD